VIDKSYLKPDLLKRRREAGLVQSISKPSLSLIRQGYFIGCIIFLITLIPSIITVFQHFLYYQEKKELNDSAIQYDNLLQEVENLSSQLKSLSRSNQQLAGTIMNLNSSSAMLTKISRVIPSTIKLNLVQVDNKTLIIKGLAKDNEGLDIVNRFILNLDDSNLFQEHKVTMEEAVLIEPDDTGLQENKKFLKFNLTAKFLPTNKSFNRNQLTSLGSLGLAKRIDILNKQGFLK